MKKAFRESNIRSRARKGLADFVLKTIREHEEHDILRVTSRQLYYRLVAANAVPNSEKSYKMVTALLADMRYWGMIDWNFIVDLGREPIIPQEFRDVNHLASVAVNALRYDRWEGQKSYVEVWVEKQALQSVLEPVGDDLHVPVVVNKGYSSASAMYQAALRLINARKKKGRETVVLYFGDFDPSGEDMVRDVKDRLEEFGATPVIRKIALRLEQILEHACPPNPAKTTDSRFEGFAEKMRDSDVYEKICKAQGIDAGEVYSWELDSLPVEVLSELVRSTVMRYIDSPSKKKAVIDRENKDRMLLKKAAGAIADGTFGKGD